MTTLLHPDDAAAWLGIKPTTLRQWRHLGKPAPRATQFGPRTYLYPLIAVISFGIHRIIQRKNP